MRSPLSTSQMSHPDEGLLSSRVDIVYQNALNMMTFLLPGAAISYMGEELALPALSTDVIPDVYRVRVQLCYNHKLRHVGIALHSHSRIGLYRAVSITFLHHKVHQILYKWTCNVVTDFLPLTVLYMCLPRWYVDASREVSSCCYGNASLESAS